MQPVLPEDMGGADITPPPEPDPRLVQLFLEGKVGGTAGGVCDDKQGASVVGRDEKYTHVQAVSLECTRCRHRWSTLKWFEMGGALPISSSYVGRDCPKCSEHKVVTIEAGERWKPQPGVAIVWDER